MGILPLLHIWMNRDLQPLSQCPLPKLGMILSVTGRLHLKGPTGTSRAGKILDILGDQEIQQHSSSHHQCGDDHQGH